MKPAVLILGATGTVGSATVKAAVEAGWPVVAVARDQDALDALRQRHPGAKLHTLAGSVADDAGATALVAELERIGKPFAGVIAALGMGEERGRLLDQSSEQLRHTFDEAVLPQLVAARHLLPWLAQSGRNCGYVVIGGPGGRNPWAGYGHRSIAAAAIRMLARVLHGEAQAHAVRLQLLEVESPVRTDANEKHACQQWPCVEHIGRKALALLQHRNDARCTEAVIDYRSEACNRYFDIPAPLPSSADVDPASLHSSEQESRGLTLEPDQPPSSSTTGSPPHSPTQAPQEMDSDAALLPARCLQDVRTLLQNFSLPTSTHKKKNQERTK
ncbi:SDR family NAD(P)-dependent oxidoreductase [Lysobacter solisilvae (ex Woo and Kim 2020)]|uniref:SDR family oxidoreductase n=1 Tax=Agrilutibacter terrestris TaxID=2865112 RepID=A0A7H0FYF4_9GAMM|nr:SDR family oxidoreductase [Lysobacter terrestris]QNP41070.1 SDR family oxidoreductase [Lysobacter terrestris]